MELLYKDLKYILNLQMKKKIFSIQRFIADDLNCSILLERYLNSLMD